MIAWDPIAPGETLLCSIDWSQRLAVTDAINSTSWGTVSPAGGPASNPVTTVGMVTNTMIGPATSQMVGTLYSITCSISTISGQTEVETVQFACALK